MRLIRLLKNERGDTLVEVTLALTIMSAVLSIAFVTANRGYLIGQQSKERVEITNQAQQQAEALKNFRDIHTWVDFHNHTGTFTGVDHSYSGSCNGVATQCFHMVYSSGLKQWLPAAGGLTTGVGGTIAITHATPTICAVGAASCDYRIAYSLPLRGGGTATGNITLKLANLDALIP